MSWLSKIKSKIVKTEWFSGSGKKMLSRWELFEFYTETTGQLLHVQEDGLKAESLFWNIDFKEDGSYIHAANLNIPVVERISEGTWEIRWNFLSLSNDENPSYKTEFQFAVGGNILKLLKKSKKGEIEVFGFFRTSEKK